VTLNRLRHAADGNIFRPADDTRSLLASTRPLKLTMTSSDGKIIIPVLLTTVMFTTTNFHSAGATNTGKNRSTILVLEFSATVITRSSAVAEGPRDALS